MQVVRAAALTGFIEVCYFVGLDPFELLRDARINARFLDDIENRHAAAPVLEMIETAAAKSRCNSFGLLMAKSRSFASLGPLALLLQHLGTIDEVLSALNEYGRLINDVVSLECIRGENRAPSVGSSPMVARRPDHRFGRSHRLPPADRSVGGRLEFRKQFTSDIRRLPIPATSRSSLPCRSNSTASSAAIPARRVHCAHPCRPQNR